MKTEVASTGVGVSSACRPPGSRKGKVPRSQPPLPLRGLERGHPPHLPLPSSPPLPSLPSPPQMLSFMCAHLAFFHQGYDLFSELGPYMKDLGAQVTREGGGCSSEGEAGVPPEAGL